LLEELLTEVLIILWCWRYC